MDTEQARTGSEQPCLTIRLPVNSAMTPARVTFTVDMGDELHTYPLGGSPPPTWENGSSSPLLNFFRSHCTWCGETKHSTNYCPLRKCSVCGKYGHVDRVCFCRRWKKDS